MKNNLEEKIFNNYRTELYNSSKNLGFDPHNYTPYNTFNNICVLKINNELIRIYDSANKFIKNEIEEHNITKNETSELLDYLIKNGASEAKKVFMTDETHNKDTKIDNKQKRGIIKDIVNAIHQWYNMGIYDELKPDRLIHENEIIKIPIKYHFEGCTEKI